MTGELGTEGGIVFRKMEQYEPRSSRDRRSWLCWSKSSSVWLEYREVKASKLGSVGRES